MECLFIDFKIFLIGFIELIDEVPQDAECFARV